MNNRRGELCETPMLFFSQGLVELAPPKGTIPVTLCARNMLK